MEATISGYKDYVSLTYTPKPKTKKEKEMNKKLLDLFGEPGRMAAKLMEESCKS